MIRLAIENGFKDNNQAILTMHIDECEDQASVSITYCAENPKQVQFHILDDRIVAIKGETNIYIIDSINEYLGGL